MITLWLIIPKMIRFWSYSKYDADSCHGQLSLLNIDTDNCDIEAPHVPKCPGNACRIDSSSQHKFIHFGSCCAVCPYIVDCTLAAAGAGGAAVTFVSVSLPLWLRPGHILSYIMECREEAPTGGAASAGSSVRHRRRTPDGSAARSTAPSYKIER